MLEEKPLAIGTLFIQALLIQALFIHVN
jgi:hypothetical protein